MPTDLVSLLGQAKDWGARVLSASPSTPTELTLGVYRRTSNELIVVGHLSREKDEYVFRYDSGYEGDPITAFPIKDKEYRSPVLWPFFLVRIPPLDREDVREEIMRRKLSEDQVLEILGTLGKFSVANPYEFKVKT